MTPPDAARRLWNAAADWWWRIRSQIPIASANLMLAIAVALTTAVLGLVVQDLLPTQGSPHLYPDRVALLTVTLILLVAAIVWRSTVHRSTGTLFYVRVLDDEMPDWHQLPLAVAARSRMSLKSITRWVDLAAHTRDGVIDTVDTCHEVASALEAVINGDRDDTAYTIAPNLLWPAALAVGAELPIVDNLNLLELPGNPTTTGTRARTLSFRLTSGGGPADSIKAERIEHPSESDAPIGLILAFAPAAVHMTPEKVFAGQRISACHRLTPSCFNHIDDLARTPLTAEQIAALAFPLAQAISAIQVDPKRRAVVIAAAMPKTLAMALGWHLAQGTTRFFANTYLLHYHRADTYVPIRVHHAQPTGPPPRPTPLP